MTAIDFVQHARTHGFTAAQVSLHFPQLPQAVCEGLLAGTAWIDRVNPDGSVVVDDGK